MTCGIPKKSGTRFGATDQQTHISPPTDATADQEAASGGSSAARYSLTARRMVCAIVRSSRSERSRMAPCISGVNLTIVGCNGSARLTFLPQYLNRAALGGMRTPWPTCQHFTGTFLSNCPRNRSVLDP